MYWQEAPPVRQYIEVFAKVCYFRKNLLQHFYVNKIIVYKL